MSVIKYALDRSVLQFYLIWWFFIQFNLEQFIIECGKCVLKLYVENCSEVYNGNTEVYKLFYPSISIRRSTWLPA